ncbi:hypothetical protein B4U80_05737 [Leptotrombidium deliense]|uniref:Uncharacterized protein n=1 Tax=Leptotrombidium deliense TaxID=299467 RepID=A0A443SCJ7_9ACAR|nr:hypothetical protein B4U80_05737 [Leptotrombidium deliense]
MVVTLLYVNSYLSKLDRCSDGIIESICNGTSVSYLKNILSGYQGEINDLVCNQGLRWGSKTCNSLTKNLKAVDSKVKKPLSVIPIILDLMKRIIKQ